MPPAKRRKLEVEEESQDPASSKFDPATSSQEPKSDPNATSVDSKESSAANKAQERKDRFKALQARAQYSAQRNLKEAAAESSRLATDPNLLASLSRKQAFASHNLLKADTEASGADFERKRAWDWTIDESERWDKRMSKKERHREDVSFQDYTQDAQKIYKRQLRELQPDMEGYEKEKAAAVQRAAMNGGLEIVETEDGEVIAVDKTGAFYSTADSTDFIDNKPDKAAVDRMVKDLQKAEEVRLRKRRDRGKGEDDGDITFINDKNKQFNQKLARFYNKYTAEIRDSFERGTMI